MTDGPAADVHLRTEKSGPSVVVRGPAVGRNATAGPGARPRCAGVVSSDRRGRGRSVPPARAQGPGRGPVGGVRPGSATPRQGCSGTGPAPTSSTAGSRNSPDPMALSRDSLRAHTGRHGRRPVRRRGQVPHGGDTRRGAAGGSTCSAATGSWRPSTSTPNTRARRWPRRIRASRCATGRSADAWSSSRGLGRGPPAAGWGGPAAGGRDPPRVRTASTWRSTQ